MYSQDLFVSDFASTSNKKAGADPGKIPVKQPPQLCVVLLIVLFILLSVQP